MGLPNQLTNANPADSEALSLGASRIRALIIALEDLLGIPDATLVSNAAFAFMAAGLKSMSLQDAAVDPTTAGQLQRNGSSLKWHNGTIVVDLTQLVPSGTVIHGAFVNVPT